MNAAEIGCHACHCARFGQGQPNIIVDAAEAHGSVGTNVGELRSGDGR